MYQVSIKSKIVICGHDESEQSSNKSYFIEILKILARNSEKVVLHPFSLHHRKVVLLQ